MKTYKPKHDPHVKAVQFFRKKVKTLPKGLIEKVWASVYEDHFVRNKDDRRVTHNYEVEYVLTDQNQYLRDGQWIVISHCGYGCSRIETDEIFKLTFQEAE